MQTTVLSELPEADRKLIEQANKLHPWEYCKIDDLIAQAQTKEARIELYDIGWNLYDLMQDSL